MSGYPDPIFPDRQSLWPASLAGGFRLPGGTLPGALERTATCFGGELKILLFALIFIIIALAVAFILAAVWADNPRRY